jgi:hypothetical protein
MIPVPSGVRVWLAVGHTDMRRGMNSLALQVQEGLKRDPHAGDLYVFRGKRGHLRGPLPAHLPRERVVVPAPPSFIDEIFAIEREINDIAAEQRLAVRQVPRGLRER